MTLYELIFKYALETNANFLSNKEKMDNRLRQLEFTKYLGCKRINKKGIAHLEFFWVHLNEQ